MKRFPTAQNIREKITYVDPTRNSKGARLPSAEKCSLAGIDSGISQATSTQMQQHYSVLNSIDFKLRKHRYLTLSKSLSFNTSASAMIRPHKIHPCNKNKSDGSISKYEIGSFIKTSATSGNTVVVLQNI